MRKEIKSFIEFLETTKCFTSKEKIKLILFALGFKKAAHVELRIKKNLEDKYHFEEHLKEIKAIYQVSRVKGFEEIRGIKKNAIIWQVAGVWYSYDCFANKKIEKKFLKYKKLIEKYKHKEADKLAAEIYSIPSCCAKASILEHDKNFIARNYSYYQYYEKINKSERLFPFITWPPCSTKCKESAKLNLKYLKAIKKFAPNFYKHFSEEKKYIINLIVDNYSDIYLEEFDGVTSIWPKKDGFEYALITLKPIDKKYYLFSWLTKDFYERGTILNAEVRMKYNYADIKIKEILGQIKNLYHKRKLIWLSKKLSKKILK